MIQAAVADRKENMAEQYTNPLQGLIVDEGEQAIDTRLNEVLRSFLAFTKDGRIVSKPEFLKLSHPNRILVALLGRHAMVRLCLPNAALEAAPEDLVRDCLVKLKSCREYLSRMKTQRLLEKNEKGYFVPTWALPNATDAVKKGS